MMSDSTAVSAPTPRQDTLDFSNLKLSVPLKTTKATVDAAKRSRRRSRFLLLRDDSCECLYPKLIGDISPKGKTDSSSGENGDMSDRERAIEALKNGKTVPLPGLDRGDSNSTSSTVSTSVSALSARSERADSNTSEAIVDGQISLDESQSTPPARPQLGSQDSFSSLGSNDPVNAANNSTPDASPIPSGVADDIDIEEQRRLLEQFSFSMTMNNILSSSDSRRNSSPAQFVRSKTRKTLAEMEEEQFRKLGRNQQRFSQRILSSSS